MCRALKVLCAASSRERLKELKQAAVSVSWELVGGAISLEELVSQVEELRPDVVVLDPDLGADAAIRVRRVSQTVRIMSLGPAAGADEVATMEAVREAILGLPHPGGPILL